MEWSQRDLAALDEKKFVALECEGVEDDLPLLVRLHRRADTLDYHPQGLLFFQLAHRRRRLSQEAKVSLSS